MRIISSINTEIVSNIFFVKGLPRVNSFKSLEVGFTNEVYEVNNKYVLKICGDKSGEVRFRREAKLYNYFKGILPVPNLISFDNSKALLQKSFMIYHKIEGKNLYNVWHTYSDQQKKNLINQLCDFLRKINSAPLSDLPKDIGLNGSKNWKDVVIGKIDKHLETLAKMGTLNKSEKLSIKDFVTKNSSCLEDQKLALVYWDAHFDNILVDQDKIIGLLDLEATEIASIDHALDVAKRMVDYPKKYMSEYAEQFAKREDYAHLLDWYREFYPELFQFKKLNLRLDIYAIEHDLMTLTGWPEVKSLQKSIINIVNK